jgi:hypothetical protein
MTTAEFLLRSLQQEFEDTKGVIYRSKKYRQHNGHKIRTKGLLPLSPVRLTSLDYEYHSEYIIRNRNSVPFTITEVHPRCCVETRVALVFYVVYFCFVFLRFVLRAQHFPMSPDYRFLIATSVFYKKSLKIPKGGNQNP